MRPPGLLRPERWRAFYGQMRLSLKSALQFRANYALIVLSVVISAAVEIALWSLVMKDRGQVAGFGINELLIYLVIANITAMISVNWESVLNFSEEIRSGRVSRHLLKPMSLFHVTTADWLASKIPVFLGIVPVYVALGWFWPVLFQPSLTDIALYILGLAVSLWLCAEIYFLIMISAFWIADNAGIAIAFNVFRWGFIGAAFPLSFYPKWLVDILDATPLPYLAYYPTLMLMGRLPVKIFLLKTAFALAICVAHTVLRRLIWKIAEHRLQTVGG